MVQATGAAAYASSVVDVEYGRGLAKRASARTRADGLLDRIADAARRDGRPQDVQVTVEDAGTLGIVIGADWSVLSHVPADRDPPYVVSVGRDQSSEPARAEVVATRANRRRVGRRGAGR